MKWQNVLIEKCRAVNAEPIVEGDKLYIACASEPTEEFKAAVLFIVPPEITFEIKVAPKPSTLTAIQMIAGSTTIDKDSKGVMFKGDHIIFDLRGLDEDAPFWNQVSTILKNDGFFKTWTFIIDGVEHLINPKLVDVLAKNATVRESIITDDDMLNLQIVLGNAQTIDDIINAL